MPSKKPVQEQKTAVTTRVDALVMANDSVLTAISRIQQIPAGEVMDDEVLRREIGCGYEKWRRIRGNHRLSGFSYKMPDNSLRWGQKATIKVLSDRMKEVL